MKKLNFMLVMLIIVVIGFTACSNQGNKVNSDADNSVSFLADKNETVSTELITENESSTQISTTESTTAQTTTNKPKETKKKHYCKNNNCKTY